jgi:hypothetical protein
MTEEERLEKQNAERNVLVQKLVEGDEENFPVGKCALFFGCIVSARIPRLLTCCMALFVIKYSNTHCCGYLAHR